MQVTSSTQLAPTFTLVTGAAGSRTWQVGALLHAKVVDIARDGGVTLRIGDALLSGKSPVPLQRGQSITLEVVQTGAQPVLKILDSAGTAGSATHDEQIAEALRTNLPRQAPLPQLFAKLTPLAQPQTQVTADLTRPLLEQITQLIGRLAHSRDTSHAAGLRRALNDSGVFLEAKLSRPNAEPAQFSSDIKAGLLQLRAALVAAAPATSAAQELPAHNTGAPPLRGAPLQPQAAETARAAPGTNPTTTAQLLTHIDAALARIQLSQIASLPVADDKKPAWMFELPVRHGELVNVFHVRIEAPDPNHRHSDTPQANTLPWCIELAFDLEQLGPMHARISTHQSHVSVSLWAQRTDTVSLFNQQLEMLRSSLQQDGLEVDNLVCLPGSPPALNNSEPVSHRLLSLKA